MVVLKNASVAFNKVVISESPSLDPEVETFVFYGYCHDNPNYFPRVACEED